MKRFTFVLILAGLAGTGCATYGKGPGGSNTTMVSIFPSDALGAVQVEAFADSARAMAANGNGGFASHCQGSTCTQISAMPSWAGGSMVGGTGMGSTYSPGQAFADAVENAPVLVPQQAPPPLPTEQEKRLREIERRQRGLFEAIGNGQESSPSPAPPAS